MQLLKKNSKYYKLIGFYYFNNSKEFSFPVHSGHDKTEFKKTNPLVQQVHFKGYGFFTNTIEPKKTDYTLIQNAFISDLGLDPASLFIFDSKICSFFFHIYQEPLSFDTAYYTDPEKMIFDFVNQGQSIYLLKSSFRMLNELSKNISNSYFNNSREIDIIDKNNFNLFFFKNKIENKNSNTIKETIIPEQLDFNLCQDYNKELLELREKIISYSKNNGGLLKFSFNNKDYFIPKIPFLIWSKLIGQHYFTGNTKFNFDNFTWNTVCTDQGIKTQEDSLIHSDWWIGAGFPIEVYHNNFNYYFEFNKALNLFSHSYFNNFSLNSAITLAGHDLPVITGRVVLRPQSLDDFNEDDIIVLPNASVEFDPFIKKCCKNGKGAVIVEVSNKVSHLVIVSREMNQKGKQYRLLSMPNAYETLKNNYIYSVDTQNNLIKIFYD